MRTINYILKSVILIVFIIASSSYLHIIESKTYNDTTNKSINISTMALKADEFRMNDIYSAKDTFTGDLTAYVYNCPLCTGLLACNWRYNVMDGTTTYDDDVYGNVRIVASSRNLPCGSIIRFDSKRVSEKETYAIVLDRGVRGNAIDLLIDGEDNAKILGRSIITYDVLRFGWGNEG